MRIVIPGSPVPNARHGMRVIGKHACAYDKQAKQKAQAKRDLSIQFDKLQVEQNDLEALYSSPLCVSLSYHMPIPISDSKAIRNQKLWGLILPTGKPDSDNLNKWTFDIANGILWRDDAQIVKYEKLEMIYSETPCTILEVEVIKMTLNDDAIKMTHIFSPAALEKLESDLTCLSANLESVRLCQREDRNKHLECAAGSLKAFASTYNLSLKKMSGGK